MHLQRLSIRKQAGFSAVEALLVVFVIAVLSVISLVVYHRYKSTSVKTSAATSQTQTPPQKQSTVAQSAPVNTYDGWKTFTSSADHFSLKYPPTWVLNMTNAPYQEVGYDSGTLTSPSKTVLNLYANTGGKGGWCNPRSTDVPFQKGNACTTFEYLTSEKLPVNNLYYSYELPNTDPVKFVPKPAPVYLVTTHYADPTGVSSYGISIAETTTPEDTFTLNTPYMGSDPPYTWLTVEDANGKGYPYVYVYANGDSPSFLTSDDAATIKNIMRSFTLDI